MDQGKMIYSLQKYMILQTKLNPQTQDSMPDEYAYAWYVDMYPFFSDAEWHENVKEHFTIGEEKVSAIIEYLDEEWLNKKYYNYYELESHFRSEMKELEIGRGDLICVLRYVHLHGGFDDHFWEKLLEPMQHPIEATSIVSAFSTERIYLV